MSWLQDILVPFFLLCSQLGLAWTCTLEQPVLTYGNKTGHSSFSFVVGPGCLTGPYVILYNTVTGISTNIIAQNTKRYSATVEGSNYDKTAYFFSAKLTQGQRYAWMAKGDNSLGPYYFTLRDYSKTMETRLAMISDADISPVSAPTFSALRKLDWSLYDGLIHGGDFAYNVENDGGARGDNYFNNITSIITQVPFLVVPGNHENYDNAKLFNYRFRMPNFNDDYSNNVYFKVVNSVLFVFINYDYFLKIHKTRFMQVFTYVSSSLDAFASDPSIRWRVVVTHRPIYCGDYEKSDCTVNFYVLKPFDDMFKRHKIDVFLESHEHIYERLFFMSDLNIYNYTARKVGPTFEFANVKQPLTVICGLAGTSEELKSNVSTAHISYFNSSGTQSWLDIRITETSFQVDLIGSASGSLMDSVRIVKTSAVLESPGVQEPSSPDGAKVGSRPNEPVTTQIFLASALFTILCGLATALFLRNQQKTDSRQPQAAQWQVDPLDEESQARLKDTQLTVSPANPPNWLAV